jgi:hypothetical protein
MADPIVPGQLFTYRGKRRLLRRQLGAGQILGGEANHNILFVRIFDVSGEDLTTLIGVLPITTEAFERSNIKLVKWLPLPNDWEGLRDQWRVRWRDGEAAAFSEPLRDATEDTLETVNYLRGGGVIELAFPKRSQSGRFDTIEAFVREGPEP